MSTKYYDLAPGNVLQNMYLKRRLKQFSNPAMNFIEVGAGNGNISKILLEAGLTGIGYDLNETACSINKTKNAEYIQSNKYQIICGDFFDHQGEKADIIISSHVIEHIPPEDIDNYFRKCKATLKPKGRIITLVPSSMKYWGIEDETVGHYKRYEFDDFDQIAQKHQLKIEEIAGLTYPLSNMLFRLSNYLIRKNESWKTNLSKEEQTLLSSSGGARKIKLKTQFPYYFKYLINDFTMIPFHALQLMNRKNRNSMVIYSELMLADNA